MGNQDNIILILRIDLYHADQLIVALEVDRRKARAADAVFRCGGTLNLSILGDEQEIALFAISSDLTQTKATACS